MYFSIGLLQVWCSYLLRIFFLCGCHHLGEFFLKWWHPKWDLLSHLGCDNTGRADATLMGLTISVMVLLVNRTDRLWSKYCCFSYLHFLFDRFFTLILSPDPWWQIVERSYLAKVIRACKETFDSLREPPFGPSPVRICLGSLNHEQMFPLSVRRLSCCLFCLQEDRVKIEFYFCFPVDHERWEIIAGYLRQKFLQLLCEAPVQQIKLNFTNRIVHHQCA